MEPVYEDHPGDQDEVDVADRWSLYRGTLKVVEMFTGWFSSGHLG